MAQNIEVDINVNNNISGSIAQLKALKKELKNTAVGTEEFKKLYNEIDDLEDKIKSAKNVSSDWIDSLEMAGGSLGMLGGALNKGKVATQSFGAALKATGIGLIVALIGGLVGAFSQSETSMKKLEPLFIGLEKIMGGILEVAQPMIDMFIELALKAMPYVTKAVGIVYSAVAALFTYIKTYALGVGKVFKGIFTFSWDTIVEGVNEIGSSFGKTAEAYNKSMASFEEGNKKVTKTQKKNAEDAATAAEKARQAALKEIETRYKLLNANLESDKAEAISKTKTEEDKLKSELLFAKKTRDNKINELAEKQKLYKKESDEYKGLQAEKITADNEYKNKQNEFKAGELERAKTHNKAIYDAELKYKQDVIDLTAKTEQEKLDNWLMAQLYEISLIAKTEQEKQRLIIALDADYEAKLKVINDKKKQDKLAAKAQGYLDDSSNENLSFAQRFQAITDREALVNQIYFENDAARTAFEKQNSDARKKNSKDESDAKRAHLQSYLNAASAVADLLGKQTAEGKALAIAVALISTYSAIAKQLEAFSGVSIPGYAIAEALATGVVGFQQVAGIMSVDVPGGGGGGGVSSAAPQAPSFNVVGVGGMNQVAQTLGADKVPIKAYVVSQDVTTQQALDRNIIKTSSLG